MYGGGDYHHINIFQVICTMADADFSAKSGQAFGDVRTAQIRTGYFVTQVKEDFGYSAHADAADADEVYFIDFSVHGDVLVRFIFYSSSHQQ